MSLAELTVPIAKEWGAACGFTLIRNSCTINKIVGDVGGLKPGDLILRINGVEVDEDSVRLVLRDCRNARDLTVTVARASYNNNRFADQQKALGMFSPDKASRGGCLCALFSKQNPAKPNPTTNSDENHPPDLAPKSFHPARRQSSTLSRHDSQTLGSANSLSSGGMRTVDLRKLHKEGAATMWKADRSASLK